MLKEITVQYQNEVWNEKNLVKVDEFFHPDAKIHSTLGSFVSPREMKAVIQKWLNAFPDLEVKHLKVIEEGDHCVAHWEAKGTHQGEFKSIPPKRNKVHYRGSTHYLFKDGKVVEYWAYIDNEALIKQMNS